MRAYDASAKRQVYGSYRHSQPTGGIREAKKRQGQLAEEIRTGKVSADSATFGHLLDRFLEHSISIGRAPTTIHGYRVKIGKIESALGRIPLRKLTAGDIDAWYGQLAPNGMSPATIKHHHRLIVAALNQAMKWDMVPRNVATLASPPKAAKFEINPPTQQRVNELIALAKESRMTYLADLLYLVAVLGLRKKISPGCVGPTSAGLSHLWWYSDPWPRRHQRFRLVLQSQGRRGNCLSTRPSRRCSESAIRMC